MAIKKRYASKLDKIIEDLDNAVYVVEENGKQVVDTRNPNLPVNQLRNKLENRYTQPIQQSTKSQKENTWFSKGDFEDGFDLLDIPKVILGTVGDVGLNVVHGAGSLLEGVVDLGTYGVSGISKLAGNDKLADRLKERASLNAMDELLGSTHDFLDKHSVLGEKSDRIGQGLGQVGGILATGGLGAAGGLGTAGVTALTTGVTGLSSMGSGMGEAYQSGATDEEALTYGAISGTAEAITELIFGGLGKAVNAVGLSKGLTSLDDAFAKKVTSKISNQIAKNFVEYGIKAGAEGTEEVLSGIMQAAGKKMTYMSEEDLGQLIKDEQLLDQFIMGTVTSGFAQSGIVPTMKQGSLIEANKTGRDFITGYTQNEQKVIDSIVKEQTNSIAKQNTIENEVKKAIESKEIEQGGILSTKEKNALREQILAQIESGDIDTSKTKVSNKEISKIRESVEEQMQKGLLDTNKIESILPNTDLSKDSFLQKSYLEKARKSETFTYDNEITDAKEKAVYDSASKYFNNTTRSHEFVEKVAKISKERGTNYAFINNEELKTLGHDVEGKQVNGLVRTNKDGEQTVLINIDSPKALNTIVGHETTHLLEGTQEYQDLQEAIFNYAKEKGDFDARQKSLSKLYDGIDNANINSEITADLVGDYLFTDDKFINSLSTQKPTVFQKIKDLIDDLVIKFKGTKEEKQLREVQKKFKEAYKQNTSNFNDPVASIQNVSEQNKITTENQNISSKIAEKSQKATKKVEKVEKSPVIEEKSPTTSGLATKQVTEQVKTNDELYQGLKEKQKLFNKEVANENHKPISNEFVEELYNHFKKDTPATTTEQQELDIEEDIIPETQEQNNISKEWTDKVNEQDKVNRPLAIEQAKATGNNTMVGYSPILSNYKLYSKGSLSWVTPEGKINTKVVDENKIDEFLSKNKIDRLNKGINPFEKGLSNQVEENDIAPSETEFKNYTGISKLKQKYDSANKVRGNSHSIVLNDGQKLSGTYVLTESGSVTSSHNSKNFAKSENFPLTEQGTTINDRDYENDKMAQQEVIRKAQIYDGRAFNDNGVIVTKDGIVVSGNDRTMAGEIASRNNTDQAYIEYLKENAEQFGFTKEQIESMKHPRVVLELDEKLEYNTKTFAQFNKDSKKTKSVSEKAKEIGKTIDDNTITKISNVFDNYDTIDQVYNSQKATKDLMELMLNRGIVEENEISQVYDGEKFTGAGKDLIEATIIGSVISEDNVKYFRNNNNLKFKIMKSAPSIIQNRTLGDYSIINEINNAMNTYKKAQQSNMTVDEFSNQTNIFGDNDVDLITKRIAKILENKGYKELKTFIEKYNDLAIAPANGQVDLFTGKVPTKENVLNQALNINEISEAIESISQESVSQTQEIDIPKLQELEPTKTIIEPTIDEDLARRAVEAYSFRDYKMGSTTETWKQQVQEAKEKLDTLDFLTQEQKDNILQRYKKKTADWYNKKNSITSQNVSPMIAGPAKFNYARRDKLSAREGKMYEIYDDTFNIEKYYKDPVKARNEKDYNIDEKNYTYGDIEVIQNKEDNRLQLKFDGKPSPDIITKLKKNGFRWSPKNQVWQRQLTPNALYTFNRIKDELTSVKVDTTENITPVETKANDLKSEVITDDIRNKVLELYNKNNNIDDIIYDDIYNHIMNNIDKYDKKYSSFAKINDRTKEYINSIINEKTQYSLNADSDLSYQNTQYTKAWGRNITVDKFLTKDIKIADNLRNQTETFEQLEKAKNNPDADITIYRATTSDSINTGDWVFLDRTLADRWTRTLFSNQVKQGYKVVAEVVKAKDVDWTGKNLEFVYSPNGERSVDTQYSLTDNQGRELSKEQQEYFKDSKVRDENGNLLTVYHGTRANFNIFDINKAGSNFENGWLRAGKGFYFAEDKADANGYGEDSIANGEANVKEVYLNITNPFDTSQENTPELAKIGEEYGIDPFYLRRGDFLLTWFRNNNINAADVLQKYGYDGVTDFGHYVAFNSNQIKNVDNTNPTTNNDIRYQLSNPNEEIAPIGDYNVYGKDIKLSPLDKEIESLVADLQNFSKKVPDRKTFEERVKQSAKEIEKELGYMPKNPTKESTYNEEQKEIAKILVEEPKTQKQKNARKWAIFRASVFDKGTPFEDLSLKTRNRELMGKWDYTLTSEARGQNIIGKGHFEDGIQTSKSLNDIRAEVDNTGLTKEFYEYMYHKHNVDRMKVNKPVFGDNITSEISKAIVEQYEMEHPEFMDYAQDVYDYVNADKRLLVKHGITSQETADLWADMYPNYVPIRRANQDGNAINVPLDTNRTGVNAPIKRATGGSSDILPLFDTMAMRTLQTQRAIAKNNFGVELKNTLGTTIESSKTDLENFVDSLENSLENQEGLLQEGKDGKNPTFTVFENGNKVTFEITQDMYDALKPVSEKLSKTVKPLNIASNFHKGVITEYNPVFMLTNSIKDVQEIIINSQHAVKTYATIPEATAQLFTKGYWYQEYVNNGGEQNSYFDNETNTFDTKKNVLLDSKLSPLKWISTINNTIEIAPRLAEYIASRKSGRSIEVSMLDAARVTTNFKAGGDVTKALNRNGVTFLNASVQGAMQQVRNVREANANGLKGWVNLATKFAVAGLTARVLNDLLWGDDDEYEDLSDYVKQNYYVVAKDDDGTFIRIPKGRTVAVIQESINQMSNLITGDDEVDLKNFLDLAITNLAPNNPIDNNILSPIVDVLKNEAWYGGDLVPSRLQDLPSAEQYDESTDKFSRWLGEKTGWSPYKINYLLNQYTGGVGDVVLPMITPEKKSKADSLGEYLTAPFKDKFTTNATMNNQNVSDFYDISDELTKKAKSSKATDKDVLSNKYINSVMSEMNELYKEKREVQNSNLSNSKKYDKVLDIQAQINELAEEALSQFSNVSSASNYSTVGDREYYKNINEDGEIEWTKVREEEAEDLEVLGLTKSEKNTYFKVRDEIKSIDDDSNTKKADIIDAIKGTGFSDEQKAYLYKKYYNTDTVDIMVSSGVNIDDYFEYAKQEFVADKDEDGKSISGSRKAKVISYVNSLDLSIPQKAILIKSTNTFKFNDYNDNIIDYVNELDITYEEKTALLEELDMKVDANGNISWE